MFIVDVEFVQRLLEYAKSQDGVNESNILVTEDNSNYEEYNEGEMNIPNDLQEESGNFETEVGIQDPSGNFETEVEKRSWAYAETLALIVAVESHYDEMFHAKKRRYVWQNIANDLLSQNISFSTTECSKKWQNLMRTYKVSKDVKTKSGRGPTRFLFFDRMDEFLGDQPNNSSPHSIDVNSPSCSSHNLEVNISHSMSNPGCSSKNSSCESTVSGSNCQDTTDKENKVSNPRKRRNIMQDYIKRKTCFLQNREAEIQKEKEEKHKRHQERMDVFKKKMELEERRIKALEELVAQGRPN